MGKVEVKAFFKERQMWAEDLNMEAELEKFIESMHAGLRGSTPPESMRMIPTYLTVGEEFTTNDPVIVMDAGGTNFRICLTRFNEHGETEISQFRQATMPGSEGEISAKEFYGFIADQLAPFLKYSRKIGFCFSYACDMLPSHDGRLINFTKEIQIPEAIGTVVGEEIMKVLEERGHKTDDIHFVMLNDTVAALLGGFTGGSTKQYSGYAGIILGTGINSAYIEQNSNIDKLEGKLNPLGNMIINMESGDYSVSSRSPIDVEIDKATNVPGAQLMEKMISGRYLGLQVLYAVREAVADANLFSDFFKENFAEVYDLESAELTEFVEEPYGPGILSQCCANELDRENLYYIIDNIFERAAMLVTVVVAGIHIQTGVGKNPVRPLAITMEGSTFYKANLLREKIKYHIQQFVNKKYGFYNEFLHVENANVIGSALAALMNE